ncbi:MAG: hypothetical protein HQL11_04520 [Candidatus Omnitrophica bacterium]|nr:hypothetical protein [Candidatus Omnitrophota bacterium]
MKDRKRLLGPYFEADDLKGLKLKKPLPAFWTRLPQDPEAGAHLEFIAFNGGDDPESH